MRFFQILTVVTFISTSICGYDLKTHALNFTVVYAFLSTALFLLLYVLSWHRKIVLPWYWIECLNCIAVVLCLMIVSGIALSELTKPFIVTGVRIFMMLHIICHVFVGCSKLLPIKQQTIYLETVFYLLGYITEGLLIY